MKNRLVGQRTERWDGGIYRGWGREERRNRYQNKREKVSVLTRQTHHPAFNQADTPALSSHLEVREICRF